MDLSQQPRDHSVEQVCEQALRWVGPTLLLLACHYLVIVTGGHDRLSAVDDPVYHSSLLLVGLSGGLFGALLTSEAVRGPADNPIGRHRRATRFLVLALLALVLAVAGDLFIAVNSVAGSVTLGGAAALVVLVGFAGWCVLPGQPWSRGRGRLSG